MWSNAPMKNTLGFLLALALWLPTQAANAPIQFRAAPARIAGFPAQSDQGNPDEQVWVNTASAVYHCPGTRWYGKTKHGEYMKQAEAQKKGNRPAYGKVCR